MKERYLTGRAKAKPGAFKGRAGREPGRAGSARVGAVSWTLLLLVASIALAAAAQLTHAGF